MWHWIEEDGERSSTDIVLTDKQTDELLAVPPIVIGEHRKFMSVYRYLF